MVIGPAGIPAPVLAKLNADSKAWLAGFEAAIVTEIAGTTRDTVREAIQSSRNATYIGCLTCSKYASSARRTRVSSRGSLSIALRNAFRRFECRCSTAARTMSILDGK